MKTEQRTKPRVGIVNLEGRNHPRFAVDLPIEYHQINTPVSHTSRAINASEGGLLAYLPEQMEIGQHLRLKLFFASGSKLNGIEMLTEVVWIDILLGKDWENCRCGVRSVDISPEDLGRLKKFLKNLSE